MNSARLMFSIFRSRITIEDATTALAEVTDDIRSNYVQKVFPEAVLPDRERVSEELLILTMYIIDGLLKNPVDGSWLIHKESLVKRYYSSCAKLANKNVNALMELFLTRVNLWNDFMLSHLSEVNLPSRDDRLVVIGSLAGRFFAELCGHAEEEVYKMIGGGAFMTINLSTERLFKSKLVAK
jgi:hypothetical protein